MKTGIYDFKNRKLTVPVTGRRIIAEPVKERGKGSRLSELIARMLKPSRKMDESVEQMRLEGL